MIGGSWPSNWPACIAPNEASAFFSSASDMLGRLANVGIRCRRSCGFPESRRATSPKSTRTSDYRPTYLSDTFRRDLELGNSVPQYSHAFGRSRGWRPARYHPPYVRGSFFAARCIGRDPRLALPHRQDPAAILSPKYPAVLAGWLRSRGTRIKKLPNLPNVGDARRLAILLSNIPCERRRVQTRREPQLACEEECVRCTSVVAEEKTRKRRRAMRREGVRVRSCERRRGTGTRCSGFGLDVEGSTHRDFELRLEGSRARCSHRQQGTRAPGPLPGQVRCCAVRPREACAFLQIVAATGQWG